ncbi:MAG TPA: hypothetical protein VK914_07145 [bacterium]|jgi:hypothetical protein|nr:hypothetical protein [bacterium]
MALSPKEREQIVEEETLRFETRQSLHAAKCSRGHGRRFSWLWLLAFFALGYAVHGLCGRGCPFDGGSCRWRAGMLPGHCLYGSAAPDGQDSAGVPASPAPAGPDQAKP